MPAAGTGQAPVGPQVFACDVEAVGVRVGQCGADQRTAAIALDLLGTTHQPHALRAAAIAMHGQERGALDARMAGGAGKLRIEYILLSLAGRFAVHPLPGSRGRLFDGQ
ncbi:hypothetical protein D3C84_731820 [compost metagenome]